MTLNKYKKFIFILSLFILGLQYNIYLIDDLILDRFIKITCLTILFLMVLNNLKLFFNNYRYLLVIYFLFILYIIFLSTYYDQYFGLIQSLKISAASFIFIITLYGLLFKIINEEDIKNIWIIIGFFLSVQSILYFLLVFNDGINIFHVNTILSDRDSIRGNNISYGILGYEGDISKGLNGHVIARPKSWFREPALFSFFLLPPIFFLTNKLNNFRNIIFFSVILVALVLTRSLAGISSLIGAYIFIYLIKKVNLIKNNKWKISYVYFSFLIVLCFLKSLLIFLQSDFGPSKEDLIASKAVIASHGKQEAKQAQKVDKPQIKSQSKQESHVVESVNAPQIENQIKQQADVLERAISVQLREDLTKILKREPKSDSGNLVREINRVDKFIKLLIENPFGIGLGDTGRSGAFNSTNAIIFWAISTGVVGLILMLYIFIYLFNILIFDLINKKNYPIIGCLFALTLANMSYGNFIGAFYLIILAIYIYDGSEKHIYGS